MYMPSIFNNSVFDNFDNWMDFSFPSFNQRLYGASSSQLMKTDVKETDKDYEVSIDLPGFKKDELQIELKDGYLTVSGSKEVTSKDMPEENPKDATTAEADASKKDAKAEQKTVKYIRQERYSGNVSRSFYVGENLEEKDIHAKFENGTLPAPHHPPPPAPAPRRRWLSGSAPPPAVPPGPPWPGCRRYR